MEKCHGGFARKFQIPNGARQCPLAEQQKKNDQDVDAALEQAEISLAILDREPSPITEQGAGFALNGQIPLVRQELNEAAARVVRLFEDAKRFDGAQNLRNNPTCLVGGAASLALPRFASSPDRRNPSTPSAN